MYIGSLIHLFLIVTVIISFLISIGLGVSAIIFGVLYLLRKFYSKSNSYVQIGESAKKFLLLGLALFVLSVLAYIMLDQMSYFSLGYPKLPALNE